MVLSSPLTIRSVITDQTIAAYTSENERNAPTENSLADAKKTFQETLLRELFDFMPIKFKYLSLLKSAEENDNTLSGNLAQTLHELKTVAEKEIYAVADKFQQQLNQLLQHPQLPENYEELQERVKKASTYFALKVEQMLLLPLKKMVIETDNKAIRKTVQGAFNALNKEAAIKFNVTKQAAANGFNAVSYLQNKANADIDLNTAEAKSNTLPQYQTESDTEKLAYPDLYSALRNWRNRLAEEKGIPAYVIFHQKVLDKLVEALPSTLAELETIKGFGPVKVNKYGTEILSYINAYCKNKKSQKQPAKEVLPKEKTKTATQQVSFDLFQSGKTIAEIAAERDFVSSTIEGHLAYFIETGELDINQVFSQEIVDKISIYLGENQPESLNEAKNALGDEVSYSAIRTVIKHLDYKYPQKLKE